LYRSWFKRVVFAGAVVCGVAAGAVAVDATPAFAMTNPCFPDWNGNGFGGWCDGHGPQSYRAVARCATVHDGTWTVVGEWHWLGDRRGSWADCNALRVPAARVDGWFESS
jgi:hypothetical protein